MVKIREPFRKSNLKEDVKIKLETSICPKIRLAVKLKADFANKSESQIIEELLYRHFEKKF